MKAIGSSVVALLFAAAATAVPSAPAECFPAEDGTATALGVGDATLYHKSWGRMTTYHQLWEETNGIPGLQLDAGMACGAAGDTLRLQWCVGAQGCTVPL